MEIELTQYPVRLFTSQYLVTGTIAPRGEPPIYLNDTRTEFISVQDAKMTLLMPQAAVHNINVPELSLPKQAVHAIILGNYTVEQARPMPRSEAMVAFTETFVIRGNFHMSPEVTPRDVFFAMKGPFFVVTSAEIYALRPLSEDVTTRSDLLFINNQTLSAYYAEADL